MSDRLSDIRNQLDASPFVDDEWDEDMRWLIARVKFLEEQDAGLRDDIDRLAAEVARLRAKLAEVRAYAEDRAFYGKSHLNTVNSGRIATDLLAILDREEPGRG